MMVCLLKINAMKVNLKNPAMLGKCCFVSNCCICFQFRTYSRAEYLQTTNFSLDVGARLLEGFEDYFDIRYPMPKLGNFLNIIYRKQ